MVLKSDRMVIISPFLSPDMPGLLADMPSIKRIELYTNLDGYGMAPSVLSSLVGLYEYGRELDLVKNGSMFRKETFLSAML